MKLLSALCVFIGLADNRLHDSPSVVATQFRMLFLEEGMTRNQTIAALGIERNSPFLTFDRVFGCHRSDTAYFKIWPGHTLKLTFERDRNLDSIFREAELFPPPILTVHVMMPGMPFKSYSFRMNGNEHVLDVLALIGEKQRLNGTVELIHVLRRDHGGTGAWQVLPVDWAELTTMPNARTNYQLQSDDLFVLKMRN